MRQDAHRTSVVPEVLILVVAALQARLPIATYIAVLTQFPVHQTRRLLSHLVHEVAPAVEDGQLDTAQVDVRPCTTNSSFSPSPVGVEGAFGAHTRMSRARDHARPCRCQTEFSSSPPAWG